MHAALFDLDGTLADTMPVCLESFRLVLREELGREFRDAEIEAHFGPSEEGVLRSILGSEREPAATERYLEHYERLHGEVTELFPGIREALELCAARGMKMAIVTGKGARSAEISRRVLGLDAWFPRIEAGSPDAWVKVEKLHAILRAWDVPAERGFYIGDHPSDVDAARQVGLLPLSAAWDPRVDAPSLRAEGAEQTFEEAQSFTAWLERCGHGAG